MRVSAEPGPTMASERLQRRSGLHEVGGGLRDADHPGLRPSHCEQNALYA